MASAQICLQHTYAPRPRPLHITYLFHSSVVATDAHGVSALDSVAAHSVYSEWFTISWQHLQHLSEISIGPSPAGISRYTTIKVTHDGRSCGLEDIGCFPALGADGPQGWRGVKGSAPPCAFRFRSFCDPCRSLFRGLLHRNEIKRIVSPLSEQLS